MALPENQRKVYGSALGPDWSLNMSMKGTTKNSEHQITIEYNCEVKRIFSKDGDSEWPVFVELTNGKVYGCDFIISATGVIPATSMFTSDGSCDMVLAEDGGIQVNDRMETSVGDVYAAGDVCTAGWDKAAHWFQMRLWNQASQMGDYAARSMWEATQGRRISLDFCFEMFAHITRFFGYKVILLGNYDARGLGNNYQLLLRSTPGKKIELSNRKRSFENILLFFRRGVCEDCDL